MAEFVTIPFAEESSDVEQTVYEYIQNVFPDWEARTTQPEVVLTEAWAQVMSELFTIASDVPPAIFRYMGKLVNILPQEASPATGQLTVTTIDTLGHTIPAGTVYIIENTPDERIAFETVEDVVIAAGSNTTGVGAVTIQSQEAGAQSTGLTAQPQLVDIYDWISTTTLVAPTVGGEDAETDDAYLDRLATRLQLLADRPILPRDFELYAMNVLEVDRALAIDNYVPGVNEKQTIVHTATAGTFTLVFEGQTTAAINWNDSNAALISKLEALSNIAVGEVLVTGGPLPALTTIEFVGTLKESNRTQMTVGTNSLTGGGGAASLALATSTQGAAPVTNAEKALTLVAHDANGDPLTPGEKAAVIESIAAVRELNFLISMMDAAYYTLTTVATVRAYPNYDVTDLDVRVTAAIQQFFDPTLWGQPPQGEDRRWVVENKVRYLELAQVINNVEGVNYVEALTLNGGTADITMAGTATLPAHFQDITVTVNAA